MVRMEASSEIKHAARQLLGHCNLPGGYRPDSFRAALFDLWAKADADNSAALAAAFPDVAPAVAALRRSREALTDLAAE